MGSGTDICCSANTKTTIRAVMRRANAPGGLNLHDPDQDSAHVIASAAVEAYLPVQEGVWRLSETT